MLGRFEGFPCQILLADIQRQGYDLGVVPGAVIVRCIYSEDINLAALGCPAIARASHVEPDQNGSWWADMVPVSGPRLGPFQHRSEALAAEHSWLETNWLNRTSGR